MNSPKILPLATWSMRYGENWLYPILKKTTFFRDPQADVVTLTDLRKALAHFELSDLQADALCAMNITLAYCDAVQGGSVHPIAYDYHSWFHSE